MSTTISGQQIRDGTVRGVDFDPGLFVKETPRGLVDGSNTDYYLTRVPASGSLRVRVEGITLLENIDYSNDLGLIVITPPPLTGERLEAQYIDSGVEALPDISICNFRLTLESGVPVSASDQTAKASIKITPYGGNRIALYDGSTYWNVRSSAEISLALGTLANGTLYDVYLYDVSGTVTAKIGTAWASATARVSGSAGEIEIFQGVPVNKYAEGAMGARQGRYLGTFRTTSTTQTEDSNAKRFLYNYYNRVRRLSDQQDTTANWTDSTTAWHAVHGGDATWKMEFLIGLNEDTVEATAVMTAVSTGGAARLGVGLDRSDAHDGEQGSGSFSGFNLFTRYLGRPGIGYHYVQAVNAIDAGTATFYGASSGQEGYARMSLRMAG